MRHDLVALLRRNRSLVLGVTDVVAWILAFFLAIALRFETFHFSLSFQFDRLPYTIPLYSCLLVGGIAAGIHLALAWFLRLHQGRHEVASFEELFTLASVTLIAGFVTTIINAFPLDVMLPRLSVVTATALSLLLMAWPRTFWRFQTTRRRQAANPEELATTIVVGAGAGGRELVRSMHNDPNRAWDPVAFLDDDKMKRHFRFQGVSVQGATKDLAKVAERTEATTVVIAMPSVSSETIRAINTAAVDAGLDVKVLPSVEDILGDVSVSMVRDIEPADLLGRHQIQTNIDDIAGFLQDKTVLVTGAGGSIGSELCRQIRRFAPARLLMLDRDESALHTLALSMDGRADLESPDMVLADIRDRDRLIEVFTTAKPDVVFHAAALKHVNMLEHQPAEAFKTNVLGTQNVLDAAVAAGVGRFVNISTDKAASPENALGYSKRLAEGLTAGVGHTAEGTYLSVRFGNVLGTRGSVLTTFQAQIERGGPITVTHPDVTRYFMTVGEAVQLVIQAAAIGRDGEALVLDMGEPVKIDDVARQMIQTSRKPIEIVYTGLKTGEKLHEVLFASAELDERPFHPLVSHVDVPPTTKGLVETIASATDANQAMAKACETISSDTIATT